MVYQHIAQSSVLDFFPQLRKTDDLRFVGVLGISMVVHVCYDYGYLFLMSSHNLFLTLKIDHT